MAMLQSLMFYQSTSTESNGTYSVITKRRSCVDQSCLNLIRNDVVIARQPNEPGNIIGKRITAVVSVQLCRGMCAH